ncbi:MAG: ribosomal-protein-alanine N-acetyltransferase [Candidatus Eisenbacteria bacterium]|uniref:Ribosomal-protein-alanine N-acetyltransferase n=1 Tax=Eiseniibacteriota bacterium TaxID=2212470 RepID=A0A538T7K4_UNCEI|nr:MAG: ribosomal-protein-alanine N-acetyltransferase [Candidatus Eisenbacteria bacterium]TMQ59587.1 MAG: ribosomal-protein-alanine N-acetyltransferase [Candidatus Eisenbacteria bacterium]
MNEDDSLRIVPLSREHLDQILPIERASFSDPWTRGMFESELDQEPQGYVRGMLRRGTVIGYVFAVFIPDEAHIGNLAVAPWERRSGIAQRLLDQLVRDASNEEIKRVTLEVRASNHGARKFYYKNSFIDIAIRKNYYRSPVEDAIVMFRVLPEDPSA